MVRCSFPQFSEDFCTGCDSGQLHRRAADMRSFFARSDDMPKIGDLTFTGGVQYSRCHIALDVPIHSERGQDRADEEENDGRRPIRRCFGYRRRGESTATGWQPSQAHAWSA